MTTEANTIQSDVFSGIDIDADDGVAAFLSNLTGEEPKRPSTETQDEATETPQEETGAASEENTEATEEAPKETDPDDAEIEIKVGDEVKKATLKDLKRLYGQEASLTQKSQKLAEAQRIAEATHTQATAALNALIGKAAERFKPYADMDWLVLSQRMNTEDFQALRADAAAAQADLTFLQTELDQTVAKQRDAAQAAHRQAAAEAIKVLQDPTTGIKDFGAPVYNEMLQFASSHGLPEVAQMTNPHALKLVHMAMLYAKGQKATTTAAEKVTKAVQQATRVLNPKTSSASTTQASATKNSAMRNLRNSGSVEDAADAFLASFRN